MLYVFFSPNFHVCHVFCFSILRKKFDVCQLLIKDCGADYANITEPFVNAGQLILVENSINAVCGIRKIDSYFTNGRNIMLEN